MSRKAKIMTPTFTVPMHIKGHFCRGLFSVKGRSGSICGVILMELLVVLVILSLLTVMAAVSLTLAFSRSEFEKQAYELAGIFQKAHDAARESDRRYAVVLDIYEQKWVLRQFASLDFETMSEKEALIDWGYFSDDFVLDYVVFDDFADTRDEEEDAIELKAKFLAGHSGYQYGGSIIVRDGEGNPYTIIVNRLTNVVEVKPGEHLPMVPVYKEDVPF